MTPEILEPEIITFTEALVILYGASQKSTRKVRVVNIGRKPDEYNHTPEEHVENFMKMYNKLKNDLMNKKQ